MQLKWYLIIIAVCAFIASATVSIIFKIAFLYVLGVTSLGIVAVIAIDGVTAAICRLLPQKCADFESGVFSVSKREKSFYEKLHIRKWKEKVPEIGHFTGFRKNKIKEPKNPEYLKKFLHEICYGELGHFFSFFSGFLLLLLPWFKPVWLTIGIIVAAVNGFLNILPLFVLRYNSYKLYLLYKSLQSKLKDSKDLHI